MSKTKTVIPAAVSVAVAAVLIFAVLPSVRAPRVDEDDGTVVVTVTFKPERRTGERPAGRSLRDVVVIEVEMNPDVNQKETMTRSPWIAGYRPKPGQRLWVKANQAYGNEITCKIEVNGKQVSRDRNTGAQSVSCKYVSPR
jgi:hypothetical protein